MCGIYGIWHLDGKPVDWQVLEWATNRLRHRGPDDECYLLANPASKLVQLYRGEDTRPALDLPHLSSVQGGSYSLAFGFRRLAILDLSPAGRQPMASPDGRFWLMLNGEIYNYIELRQELAGLGFTFHTGTDSEVLLAAYQAWGADCLSRFNGMWAIAIWDCDERKLFLARDRFGVKPLFYVQIGQTFAFASEIKALVGGQGVAFEPEPAAIYDYLTLGRLPEMQAGATFFNDVRQLPGGYTLAISLQGPQLSKYWALDVQVQPSGGSVEPFLEPYRDLFADAVNLRLRSDVAVGTCLSGGLDSSGIVCTIDRQMSGQGFSNTQVGQQQRTFSAVYEQDGPFNERQYIDRVLAVTKAQGHFTWPDAEELRNQATQIVWHQDEPFISTSIFAQWCVMKLVRQSGVTVLLDGQGADEILGGYRPFKYYLGDLLRAKRFGEAIRAVQAISAHSDLNGWRFLRSALAERVIGGHAATSPRSRHEFELNLEALAPDFRRFKPNGMLAKDRQAISLDEHLRDQLENTSLPHLLRYEDRNSMAFSIEARLPYLDYRFVRYNFGEAAGWRIADGWSKYILRHALQPWIPDEIVWRKDKIGFSTPEGEWLRTWLLEDPAWLSEPWLAQDYLDVEVVKNRMRSWLERGEPAPTLWRWMNLELWLRAWQ